MGNSLDQYRQTIGLFNRVKYVTSSVSFPLGLCCVFIIAALMLILLKCGDIELNPGPNHKMKNLTISHTNIRGLSDPKICALKSSLCNSCNIITLSETFLGPLSSADLKLPGFHEILRRDRPTFGGGLAVYISESIPYKRRFEWEIKEIEVMWIELRTTEGKLLLCNVYRPPNSDCFWTHFANNIDHVKSLKTGTQIIILGDLNADFATLNGRKLIEICLEYNLQCHINEPTRITQNTSSCLDQIISNIPNFIVQTTVDPPISTNDHCTVNAKINFKIGTEIPYQRHIWLYDKGDYVGFKQALSTANWNECFVNTSIDEACVKWTDLFLNIAKVYIPNKTILVRPKDSPWFNNLLRKMRRKLIRTYHTAKVSFSKYYWDKYKTLNKEYHKCLNNAEDDFKTSRNNSLKQSRNTKQWWKTVKQILGRGGDDSYPQIYDIKNDTYISDAKSKAELFNEYFLSHNKINSTNSRLPDIDAMPANILESITVTENEVLDLIKCIDVNKATGHDGISGKILKAAGATIVPSLTMLLNMSFRMSKVPELWKKANVTPIHKKEDKDKVLNYRPVSILTTLSKIMEKVVFKHVYNFFHANNLLTSHQSGFRPGDSTVNQLGYLYHSFCDVLDKQMELRIVFCDVSKAFDKVWHDGLLYKLNKLGITGDLLKWFKDYLNSRQQRVLIRGQSSKWGCIEAGVPQGSVLGPLLFLVYINDIVDVVSCGIKLFADDTILYVTVDDVEQATEDLNQNLQHLNEWADQWLVNFNPQKTKAMNITNKRNSKLNDYPLQFDNQPLVQLENHKHLGLIINNKLKWTKHIDDILFSVSKIADVFVKLKQSLDRRTLEQIYFTFVRPKLEYACIIWDDCNDHDKTRIENTQHQFARLVTGAKRGTSHQLIFNEIPWPSLSERRKSNKLKFMHKIINHNAPLYLCDLLPPKVGANSAYELRNANKLIIVNARTEKFRNSIILDSVRLWNALDNETKDLNDYDDFKKNVLVKYEPNILFNGIVRKLNIIHSQLRMQCSNLNDHLYKLHVIDTSACICSHFCEDCYHFFFQCPLYAVQRIKLLSDVNRLCNVDLNVLLYGSNLLDLKQNLIIFKSVELFILETDRLL